MKKSLKIGDINNPSFNFDNWDINHTSLQDLFEIEPKAVREADIAFIEQFFSLSNENDTIFSSCSTGSIIWKVRRRTT